MKVLIDTNVVLDIILERQPFVEPAIKLLQIAQRTDLEMFLTATTITDLYYITRKAKGRVIALNFIADLLQFIDVAAVDKKVIVRALKSDIEDFEDAIQDNAAQMQAIDIIITRNESDFKNSTLKIYNPESFLQRIQ